MDFSFTILVVLAVLCTVISIITIPFIYFTLSQSRDYLEEKMILFSEFLNKTVLTITVKFRPLEILLLIGIILACIYRLIRFLW